MYKWFKNNLDKIKRELLSSKTVTTNYQRLIKCSSTILRWLNFNYKEGERRWNQIYLLKVYEILIQILIDLHTDWRFNYIYITYCLATNYTLIGRNSYRYRYCMLSYSIIQNVTDSYFSQFRYVRIILSIWIFARLFLQQVFSF